MYCRFCGKEIEDNSIYCKCCGKKLVEEKSSQLYKKVKCTKCGALLYKENDDLELDCQFCVNKNVIETQNINNTNNKEENIDDEDDGKDGSKLLLVFLLILFVCFIPISLITCAENDGFNNCNNSINQITTYSVTDNDYSLSKRQELTFYMFMITPNKDIKELTIELELYNNNNQIIYSDTITKTNLNKNSTYTFKFDYGFTSSLTGSYVRYNITGKR